MNNPITGLIHITGEPDTGKTTLAMACGFKPEEIVFFDDDLKTQAIADMLAEQGTPFGVYHNLTKLSLGKREIDFHDLVIRLIDELQPGKYKAFIFDTWTRFENTFQPVVMKNPTRFKEFYSPMGAIKGAEMWKASFDYEASVIDKMMQAAPLVILVTHLKDQSIGAVKTGKEVPDCKKPVVEKSRIRLWLRHNPDGPAPIGLVLKRLSKVQAGPNGITPINVLPRKVNPCTWERILSYWTDPIGERQPDPDEMPNDFELSILDGVLTEDQKDVLHINRIEVGKPVEPPVPAPVPEPSPKPEVLITLDLLLDAFGPEKILEANTGLLPANDEEVLKIAQILGVA
ncbi:MAG: hypothetical protein HONDAALG_02936 [Gammaproteobacteria bacterium]|jgi:hypothetical protein|nr:hypothetical protein [Gammaproteobacteria bacterium]